LIGASDDFFDRVADFQSFHTSSGPVKVPLFLRRTVFTGAFFSAPIGNVTKILPTNRLKPVIIGRGRTIYGIVAYEYLDTTIGPYNEVGMVVTCMRDPVFNVPVLPALFSKAFGVAFYFHHLPVTTKIALDSGVEIWGYPKFLATVRFEESSERRCCVLEADGEHILTLVVKKGKTTKQDVSEFKTLGLKDGTILETRARTRRQLWNSRDAESASLDLGGHPIADELRSLSVDPKPIKALYSPTMQTIVGAPSQKLKLEEPVRIPAH
jgi:acetoacetate decarboxylase